MKISLKLLEFENLFSYKRAVIDFAQFKPGLILIEGMNNDNPADSNASGKTSIIEVVHWLLFDDTIKGDNKDSIIRLGEVSGWGRLTVQMGTDELIIEKHRGKKNFLSILVNGKKIEKRTQTEALKYINEVLDLDFTVWRNSIVLGQGDSNLFLNGADKARKDMVGTILGFDLFDKCLEYIRKDRLSVTASEVTSITEKLSYIDSQIRQIGKTYEDLKDTYERAGGEAEEKSRQVDTLKQRLREWDEAVKELKRKEEVQKQLKEMQDKANVSLSANVKKSDTLKDKLNKLKEELKRVNGVTYTEDVLRGRQEELSKKVKENSSKVGLLKLAIGKLQGTNTSLQYDISDINEKIISFENEGAQSLTCPYCGQTINATCLKEMEGLRDGKKEIVDANIAKINKLKTEIKEVDDDSNAVVKEQANTQIKLATLATIQRVKRDIQSAKEMLTMHKESAEREQQRYSEAVKALIEELNQLKDVTYNRAEVDVITQQIKMITNEIGDCIKAKNDAYSNMTMLKRLVEDREKFIGQLKSTTIEHEKNKYLEKVFGKNGIRTYFLETVIPTIEERINEYLSLVNLPYRIAMSIDESKFNIIIIDPLYETTRPLSTYSGGERKLFSVLFNLAMGEFVADRKTGFDFMWLDEATDSLDEMHSELIVELLLKIARERQKKLYFITHRLDIKDLLEAYNVQRISITKRAGCSTVATSRV